MSDAFYQAFEDKHRGSRTLIKSRLSVYQPYLDLIAQYYPKAQAIDLACGRGEWLEILTDSGFDAKGVDDNRGTIEICRQRGLNVEFKNALDFLKTCADETVAVISGFHLVERIAFDDLKNITQEAFRVLKPGGILIFETPNPENILMGAHRFYIDPRHRQPISPLLLEFLPEYYGFSKVKLLRLHESAKLQPNTLLPLQDVLGGASSSTAIVAQKSARDALAIDIDLIQSASGLELEKLSSAYDQQINQQFAELRATAAEALQIAKNAEDALSFIHQSFLWKATTPIRWLEHQAQLLRQYGLVTRTKAFVNMALSLVVNRGFDFVSSRPALNRFCLTCIHKFGLYGRFSNYVKKDEVIEIVPSTPEIEADAYKTYHRLEGMSQEAHDVFNTLKATIQNNGKLR